MTIDPAWVGIPAAILTTAGYVPQALKVLREKNTRSISLGMYSIMTCGSVTWLVYGVMIDSFPIIAANAITSLLTATILVLKLKHG